VQEQSSKAALLRAAGATAIGQAGCRQQPGFPAGAFSRDTPPWEGEDNGRGWPRRGDAGTWPVPPARNRCLAAWAPSDGGDGAGLSSLRRRGPRLRTRRLPGNHRV